MHLPKLGGFKYFIQGRCSLAHFPKYCSLMQKLQRPLVIGSSRTYCADGVHFARSSLTMGLHSSKRLPAWRSGTTSDISGYRGTTLVLTVSPNVHTLMSNKRYSRPAMATNRDGTLLSLLSCGPTESQSADVWAVSRTSQPPAHIHFYPSISLKQLTCCLHQMLLFPRPTSLLGMLLPCRNIGLTWQHLPPTSMPLESRL